MHRASETSSLVEEYVDVAVVGILWRLLDDRLIVGVEPVVGDRVTRVRRVVASISTSTHHHHNNVLSSRLNQSIN